MRCVLCPSAANRHLPLLLSDDDPDVRLLACELARNLPANEANHLLGQLIARDENANVCAAAIEVLAETGDAASLALLVRCAARFPNDPFLDSPLRLPAAVSVHAERWLTYLP